MKKIYLAVFIILIASALLFIASLFYLDKEKHKLYFFTINIEGNDVGSTKIDKFITDENILYKSHSTMPLEPLLTESRSRLTLDKKYGIISYLREDSGNGAEDTAYIENNNNILSFVGTSSAEFACLESLPIKHNSFVFDEYSPLTYIPILENYDFSMGRAQAFNIVTVNSPLLPPMKRLLILTSIRDEYIKIGSKKIKVECLLIRMKNFSQGMLFVTKTGRSLVGIEFPEKRIKIMRTFMPKSINGEQFILKANAYKEEDIKFNDKKTALAGTVTIPNNDGPHPAVLLISGTEKSDRQEQGLFTYIADSLGKSGYLSLRYDRRGIGSSAGDSRASTDSDGFSDTKAALSYLSARKDVDPQKIAIIGHGKGAFYAAKLASENKSIKSVILLSPLIGPGGQADLNFDNLNEMAIKNKWDEQYLKLAIKCRMETMEKVKSSKNNWLPILRVRCFLKKLKENLQENPIDIIRKVECPTLILHGKEDDLVLTKDVSLLDKALEDSGNKNHKLMYFGYLGHFLGKPINDGKHRLYYATDPAVLDTIKKWLEIDS